MPYTNDVKGVCMEARHNKLIHTYMYVVYSHTHICVCIYMPYAYVLKGVCMEACYHKLRDRRKAI